MIPAEQLHVTPLPDDHAPHDRCWCNPIRSRVGQVEVIVHRVGPGLVPTDIYTEHAPAQPAARAEPDR